MKSTQLQNFENCIDQFKIIYAWVEQYQSNLNHLEMIDKIIISNDEEKVKMNIYALEVLTITNQELMQKIKEQLEIFYVEKLEKIASHVSFLITQLNF